MSSMSQISKLDCQNNAKKRSQSKMEYEEILSKKLFGAVQRIDLEGEESDETSSLNSDHIESDGQGVTHKKPAWVDDDDKADDLIQVVNRRNKVHLSYTNDGDKGISLRDYTQRLQKTFTRAYGAGNSKMKWAKLETEIDKSKADTSDESDEDVKESFHTVISSAMRYVDKSSSLPKGLISTKRLSNISRGHRTGFRPLRVVKFHPTRPVLMVASESGTVSLFEVGLPDTKEHFLQDVVFKDFPVTSAAFTENGLKIIVGSRRKEYLFSYDLADGRVSQLKLPATVTRCNVGRFAVSENGKFIAIIARNEVHVLSVSSLEHIRLFVASASISSLFFSASDPELLFAMAENGEVFLWNVMHPERQQSFMDDGAVKGTFVTVSKSGQFVACGSNTGIVNVYDTSSLTSRTPRPLKAFDNLTTSAECAVFNGNSEILAFSSSVKDEAMRLAHLRSKTVFKNFPERNIHIGKTTTIDFSPNSGYMAVGDAKGYLSLFRLHHYGSY